MVVRQPQHEKRQPRRIQTQLRWAVAEGSSTQPPSYDSLFGHMRQVVRDHQGSKGSLIRNLWHVVMKSVAGLVVITIQLVIVFGISVSSIVIGALNLYRCPAQPMIPVYLVVSGLGSIVSLLLDQWQTRHNKKAVVDESPPWHMIHNQMALFLNLSKIFMLAWWTVGAVFVFGCRDCSLCDRTAYLFAPRCRL